MKRRFSLFTYPMMDMKAAEAELNRRAAAGWTAEWCRRQLGAAGQPPLEGYEGVWHIRSGERTETADRGESGWVLQRGNTLFRMKGGALPDEMWLDEVLSRLEGDPDDFVLDATIRHGHGDRKALAREQQKKIALGHKPDDHDQGQQMM